MGKPEDSSSREAADKYGQVRNASQEIRFPPWRNTVSRKGDFMRAIPKMAEDVWLPGSPSNTRRDVTVQWKPFTGNFGRRRCKMEYLTFERDRKYDLIIYWAGAIDFNPWIVIIRPWRRRNLPVNMWEVHRLISR